MKKRVIGMLGLVLLAGGILAAQEASEEQEQQPQMMQRRMQQMMDARREQMMGERNALVEELRSSMESVDGLIAAVDASQGDAKTAALADAVTELAAQHKRFLDLLESQPGMMQMMQMMPMMQMMQQMMGQMQMGAGPASPQDE